MGTYCFDHGGYNLDAGRLFPSEKSSVGPGENYAYPNLPPLVSHMPVPEWPLCIAIPKHGEVVCGGKETALFRAYTPIPVNEVDEQCKWILKCLLPALLTEDFEAFCLAVERGMELGFRAREIRTYGEFQREAMDRMRSAGLRGVGMTSFGPALFGFADSPEAARDALRALDGCGYFERTFLSAPRNMGAEVVRE